MVARCQGDGGARRKDEAGKIPTSPPSASAPESSFWTRKDLLTAERHGTRIMAGLVSASWRASSASRLASASTHRSGRPARALVDYCA